MPRAFLTAVLELRPSRRKAAALERVRAEAEDVFWRVLSDARCRADHWVEIAEKRRRRTALEADLNRAVFVAAARAALAEPVAQGLARDAKRAVSSYIESRVAGWEASWPCPQDATAADQVAALDLLQSASTREQENTGRDALFAIARQPGPRPLTIARSHDAKLVRTSAAGGVAVVLNVLKATDRTARAAVLKPGFDASSGKEIKGSTSRTKLIVPVACSQWHENKFFSGRAILRSSVIRRAGDRWFMCAQFEFPVKEIRPTGARLGIDRGIVYPIAGAVVNRIGAMQSVLPPAGMEVGKIIIRADERRRREQRRCGTTSRHYVEAVNHQLHDLANSIVGEAKRHGAQVVIEKLDGFKQAIVTPREKGTRKGGWRHTLKRAQLGKLEQILTYKLAMAGLPRLREVLPGGTSITCPACGHRDPRSRSARDQFACTHCGFMAHADLIAAVNIARRGVAMEQIAKGAKLAPLEQDMVARLWSHGDGGLGPLMARDLPSADSSRPTFLLSRRMTLQGLPRWRGKMVTHALKTSVAAYSQSGARSFSQLTMGRSEQAEQSGHSCEGIECEVITTTEDASWGGAAADMINRAERRRFVDWTFERELAALIHRRAGIRWRM
jgi:IS605 OrfB family transposase